MQKLHAKVSLFFRFCFAEVALPGRANPDKLRETTLWCGGGSLYVLLVT